MALKQLNYPGAKPEQTVNTDWRLYFLDTAMTVTTTVTTVAWSTFDCSSKIPEGAVAVLVELEWSKSGGSLSRLDFRKRSGAQAVLGVSATATDTGNAQVVVPILSSKWRRSFDYEVTGSSFGTSLTVKILGYYK